MDAVFRYQDRPSPGILVRTRDASVLVRSAPQPMPLRPDSIKGRGFRAHGRSLCTSPVSSRAPDGNDKLLLSFGDEKYLQV